MKVSLRLLVLVCVVALVLPAAAMAARPDGRGGGNGYGGGGGKSDEGVLYGDLYVILRDGNGEPVLDPDNFNCPQPVYVDGEGNCQIIHMLYDTETNSCEVPVEDAGLVLAVETGRLSLSRTTDSVFDHAYTEAAKNISIADELSLDPAFRLLLIFYVYDELGVQVFDANGEPMVELKTIDSPLENLAMYQKLMKYGYFPLAEVTASDPADTSVTIYDPSENLVANSLDWLAQQSYDPDVADINDSAQDVDAEITREDLQSAATFIAAGADKGGQITLDMLVNINANLGLNGPDPRSMVYFDFSPFGSTYQTQARYGQVPDVQLLNGPKTGFPEGQIWFQVEERNVLGNAPFVGALSCKGAGMPPSGPDGPAGFFVQAADDSRAVIEFLHNWKIPVY